MNSGSVQSARVMEGMPPGLLGNRGPTDGHALRGHNSLEIQLRVKRLDEEAIDIKGGQFALGGYGRQTSRQKMSARYLDTGEWPHHHYVFRRRVDAEASGARIGARILPYQARLTGPIQFFKNLLNTWKLDSKAATVLLGLDPDDESLAGDLLAGRAALRGRDVKDRVVYLYRIRNILSSLFRDENVENQWLREPHTMLDEHSPLDLMLDGSIENLLLVKEYVEAAAGR